ncbi:MAG: flagellar basal body rod protein FlgC [Planctomycetota bacterium]|jgi:flagellar basal-body rod protein FlgC
MPINRINSSIDIAISGLQAEARRMDLIANNIANAQTTRAADGQPYRRKELVLSTSDEELEGVSIDEIIADSSPFRPVLMPGHQDADENGYVLMPNVNLPTEMINMVTASRAYQANAAVLRRYQQGVNATLELLR